MPSRMRRVGQGDIFGAAEDRQPLLLPVVEPWLAAEKLTREHDAVGFYLSAHPLDEYRAVLDKMRVQTWAEFAESVRHGATAGRLAGTVTAREERRIRSGNRMAVVQSVRPDRVVRGRAVLRGADRVPRPPGARPVGGRAGERRGAAGGDQRAHPVGRVARRGDGRAEADPGVRARRRAARRDRAAPFRRRARARRASS